MTIGKIDEAKKFNAAATEKEIDARLGEVAKGLKTDPNGLKGKLKAQGVSVAAMRQYIAGADCFWSHIAKANTKFREGDTSGN